MLEVHQFPCLSDNYGFLLHDPDSCETACIDTPDADAYLHAAMERGWQITQIWNTHWHPDHAGGNAAIKAATGCKVVAPAADAAKIEGVDQAVGQGDVVCLGAHEVCVIDVGGHTMGHAAFYLPDDAIAFVGDALFPLGCGRMFEGTAPQFWASIERLRALPRETVLYSAHEYTESNARFALHIDGENAALLEYVAEVRKRRAAGQPTVPTRLDKELAANPFLRAAEPEMQEKWGHPGDPVATFAALRSAKDGFKG